VRETRWLAMATVLVVDDEFGIAELFDAILTEEGHRVLTAINGRDGLTRISHTGEYVCADLALRSNGSDLSGG
jgi:CheY-like chemotaxis protein